MRCNYEIGDIVFYETESLFGRVIRWVTKHKHSHVAVVVSDNHVIESVAFQKSKLIPLNDTKFKSIRVMRTIVPLTEEQVQLIRDNKKDLIGVGYDYRGVFAMFKKIIFRKNLDEVDADITRLWCSELVDHLYSICGIKLVPHIDNHYVDIRDLEESPLLQEVETVERDYCMK